MLRILTAASLALLLLFPFPIHAQNADATGQAASPDRDAAGRGDRAGRDQDRGTRDRDRGDRDRDRADRDHARSDRDRDRGGRDQDGGTRDHDHDDRGRDRDQGRGRDAGDRQERGRDRVDRSGGERERADQGTRERERDYTERGPRHDGPRDGAFRDRHHSHRDWDRDHRDRDGHGRDHGQGLRGPKRDSGSHEGGYERLPAQPSAKEEQRAYYLKLIEENRRELVKSRYLLRTTRSAELRRYLAETIAAREAQLAELQERMSAY